jgi:hypothetical protein
MEAITPPASTSAADEDSDSKGKIQEELPDRDTIKASVWASLEGLVGLQKVKDQFHDLDKKVEASLKQGVNLNQERFHIKFLGNPGTGKMQQTLPLSER